MILSNIHVWSTDRFEVYKSPFMIGQRETELSNFWYLQETSQIQHEKLDLLGLFFFNLFHSLPFFITPSQNNLQINMLKKIERFCIDKCTFSKYFYQPKSFKALTILNSWNVRSQQWSKWVNWNITDDGLFPIFIHCIIVAKTWAIACQKSFLSTQAFFWNGLLKQISGEWG